MRFVKALLALQLLALAPFVAAQSAFPARPIRIILAVPAGTPTDAIARLMGQEMSARLGQPVVVDNRAGGTGSVAAESCKQAQPDGHTLCMLHVGTMSLSPFLASRVPYDPLKDFKPVTRLFFINEALVVSPALPAKSVAELKNLVTAHPGKYTYGTLQQPGADFFQAGLHEQWGAKILAVPFKGGNEVATALMGGQVDIGYVGAGNFIEQVKAGRIRMLAVRTKLAQFPDVPTFAESGLRPFRILPWWGLFAPAGTPDDVVARVHAEVTRLYADPKMRQFTEDRYMDPALNASPAEFSTFVRQDHERGGQLVSDIKRDAAN